MPESSEPNPAPEPPDSRRRPPGFYATPRDIAVLAASGVAAVLLRADPFSRWLFPVVAGHFFLFCNVFRIRRNLELIWAATFLANAGSQLSLDAFSWTRTLSIQLPIGAILVAFEMRSGRYRGIGWRRIARRAPEVG